MEKDKLIGELKELGLSEELAGYYGEREAENNNEPWLAAIMTFLMKGIGSHHGRSWNVHQSISSQGV